MPDFVKLNVIDIVIDIVQFSLLKKSGDAPLLGLTGPGALLWDDRFDAPRCIVS